jgi:hypothetical protein
MLVHLLHCALDSQPIMTAVVNIASGAPHVLLLFLVALSDGT